MTIRVAVIGGGVGGYPAAIRAARMGAQVALIEMKELGGVCLHSGCIPTKAFLQSAEIYDKLKRAKDFGVRAENVSFDFNAIAERKKQIIQRLVNGVKGLVKSNRINYIHGQAEISSPRKVLIKESGEAVEVDKIIIATGSRPARLPVSSECELLSSDEVLSLEKLPDEVLIIGGGVIGVEFAQFFSKMGGKVTIIEKLPRILLTEDAEIAQAMTEVLKNESKVNVITGAEIIQIKCLGDKKQVTYLKDGKEGVLEVDEVVAATGRIPRTEGFGLEKMGVEFGRAGIKVNEKMETNVPGIYAAGDVTGGIMLAHVASAEGECAARNAVGAFGTINYKAIPRCIYTKPEIASVGLTEEEAAKKYDIKIGRFPFYANGKALIMDEAAGMVKIIAEKKHGEILGAHIIGPQATNMVSELVLAMHMEATAEELASAIHPHPTLSEAIMEAAMSLEEGAIHLPR